MRFRWHELFRAAIIDNYEMTDLVLRTWPRVKTLTRINIDRARAVHARVCANRLLANPRLSWRLV